MNCTCNTTRVLTNRQGDPSRSLTVRRQASTDAKRRFTRLKRVLVESIVGNDAFGLRTNAPAREDQFADLPLDQQMAEFDRWLVEQENDIILEDFDSSPTVAQAGTFWLSAYLLTAFIKGMRRGRAELAKAGYDVTQYAPNASFQYYYTLPNYKDRLQYILDRSYTDLKNITSVMNADIKRVLLEGLSQGLGPKDIARAIAATVDGIGIRRAMLLARTEIIAAHHAANIAEYRAAGVIGVRVLAEWLTAGDKRVCPACRSFASRNMGNGPGIYTLDQIEFMIPAHPDCRCVAIPLDVTDSRTDPRV